MDRGIYGQRYIFFQFHDKQLHLVIWTAVYLLPKYGCGIVIFK